MEKKLKILKPALRGFTPGSEHSSASSTGAGNSGWQSESITESVPEGRDVMQTLDVAIAMCQRNSARFTFIYLIPIFNKIANIYFIHI